MPGIQSMPIEHALSSAWASLEWPDEEGYEFIQTP